MSKTTGVGSGLGGSGEALLGRVMPAALALVVFAAPVGAQELRTPVVPTPGEEVRIVRSGERGALYGRYVEATGAEVVITPEGAAAALRVPRSAISGMSVQRGHRDQRLRGALLGMGLGIVAGLIVDQASDDAPGGAAGSVGISVGVGVPLGFLVGLLIRTPEWDGVDLSLLQQRPLPRPDRSSRRKGGRE